MTGMTASEPEILRLCAEPGLGPCHMDEIEVVGESLDNVSFDLRCLRDNVLEMPVGSCLNLLSTGELLQIQRALFLYSLVEAGAQRLKARTDLLAMLTKVISSDVYYGRALAQSTDYGLALLGIIAVR